MKFFAAVLFLVLALILQFWTAAGGTVIDFVFTALIVCGFIFELYEILFFILLALFIINWEPAASLPLAVFGIVPLLAYASRKFFHVEAWAGTLAAIALGLLVLYLSISPRLFAANLRIFFTDLIASLVFGSLMFFALRYSHRR